MKTWTNFCMHDLHFQIAQAEFPDQTRCTRFLDLKLFFDISFNIDWCWNISPLHILLNAHSTSLCRSSILESRKLRNGNFRHISEIKLWLVGQYFSKWLFSEADCSKNLSIKNWSWSIQHKSLHGFQILLFIWGWFGCKFWMYMIQNHSRNCFQAFALHHLKWLCCSIGLWADPLF